MKQLRLTTLIFFLANFLIVNTALAQSLAVQVAQLATIEKKVNELQLQQQQAQQSLQKNQIALEPLLALKSPEQGKLAFAQSALDKAQAIYTAEPSDGNKAKLKNIEFKFALAERKFKKANKKQFELQKQNKLLSEQLITANAQLTDLNADIAQQRKKITIARSQELQKQQRLIADQQRQKAASAEAEIIRLKAKLEQQKIQEKERIAQLTKAAKKAAQPIVTTPPKPQNTSVIPTEVNTAAPAAPLTTEKAANNDTLSASASNNEEILAKIDTATQDEKAIVLLSTKDQVIAEELRITELLSNKDLKSKSRYGNRYLYIKPVKSKGSPKSAQLKPKGHNLYRGSTLLRAGKTIFTIGNNEWVHTVPPNKKRVKYNVIYDNSTPSKARIIYYQKSLAL